MTEHLHTEHVEGCFRCDLSRDEAPPRGEGLREAAELLWCAAHGTLPAEARLRGYLDGPEQQAEVRAVNDLLSRLPLLTAERDAAVGWKALWEASTDALHEAQEQLREARERECHHE